MTAQPLEGRAGSEIISDPARQSSSLLRTSLPTGLRRIGSFPRLNPMATALVVGFLLLLGLAFGAAGVTGARLFVIDSPSMGRAAPVGTLVIDLPAAPAGLRVGDVVTYYPPSEAGRTTTHRIVAAVEGGFRTRGDINGIADPWTVRPHMIVGRAVALLPGVGWAARMAPIVGPGIGVIWAASLLMTSATLRSTVRTLGSSLVVAAAVAILKPFSGFVVIDSHLEVDRLQTTVVSTGLLPIQLSTPGGRSLDLASGDVGTIALRAGEGGRAVLHTALNLDPLGWIMFAFVCAVPTLLVLVRPLVDRGRSPSPVPAGPSAEPVRNSTVPECVGERGDAPD